jgi:hypothetical protein
MVPSQTVMTTASSLGTSASSSQAEKILVLVDRSRPYSGKSPETDSCFATAGDHVGSADDGHVLISADEHVTTVPEVPASQVRMQEQLGDIV